MRRANSETATSRGNRWPGGSGEGGPFIHVASVRIEGFRCFADTTIRFRPGVNALIGENNSGKSTVLKALSLVLDRSDRRRLSSMDFHRTSENGTSPPVIRVSVTLRVSGESDRAEDMALVSTWLTKLDAPWEARLTFEFSLPAKEQAEFEASLSDETNEQSYWGLVDTYFSRFVSRILAGNPVSHLRAEFEKLAKLDFQFLDALRDAESQMFRSSSPLLRKMLISALDDKIEDARQPVMKEEFRQTSERLLLNLLDRVDTDPLLELARATGAEDGGVPGLVGDREDQPTLDTRCLVAEQLGSM